MAEDDRDQTRDRLHRAGNASMVGQQLDQVRSDLRGVARGVQELRDELARLRADVAEDARGGDRRGWLIQRLEERLAEFQKAVGERFADALKRLDKVEQDYVSETKLTETVAPIWKWTGIAGAALITGAIGLVFAWLKSGGGG